MRQSLFSSTAESPADSSRLPFLALPGTCSQAVGGKPEQATDVAAAWALLYTAAHIFDSVEDGDPPDPWWESLGNGPAINVATGLLTSAWIVLERMSGPAPAVRLVREDFAFTVLRMSGGQHIDLRSRVLPLEKAWAAAEAKSGAFFALSCRSGARMGGAGESTAHFLADFGFNLGMMLQIGDDLSDLHPALKRPTIPALPVAYSIETSPPERRAALERQASESLPATSTELRRFMAGNGTALYLYAKLAQHRARAAEALQLAHSHPPASTQLASLLTAVVPSA
jgi:geranylgeranyl pyrophosphate synthase